MAQHDGMARCCVIGTDRHCVAVVFYPTIEPSPGLKGGVLLMLWHLHLATVRDIRQRRWRGGGVIVPFKARLGSHKAQAGLDGSIDGTCRIGRS